jgi:asparagine synthase (glutamine-hydrolysing)
MGAKCKELLLMKEEFGWSCYKSNNKELWFKGYLITTNLHNLFAQLEALTKYKDLSVSNLKRVTSQIKGHFAFVFYWGEGVFASVDKVCSIPVYYFNNKQYKVISNNALSLKEFTNLDDSSLLKSSVLEIAMSGYTIGRNSLYKDLYQLTAGECLLASPEKLQRDIYYTYSPWNVKDRSEKHLKKEFSEATLESLELMMESVHGRQIVVPLSAGNDSRLIVSGLKHLGVKDVSCFSYGRAGSYELKTSKAVAERLGYSWTEVLLTSKVQRNFFLSAEFDAFKASCDTLSSATHIQEVNAIGLLKKSGSISTDAVIVNGNTGDFISGGHVPTPLHGNQLNNENISELHRQSWHYFLNKHFSLWGDLHNSKNDQYILNKLEESLNERVALPPIDVEHVHGIFECAEYLGRQSKYIVNMQRVYEFYGYDWRMPLWSESVLDFWETVPRTNKIGQRLYKDTLIENNWGGVWEDIPCNKTSIRPITVLLMRDFCKIFFLLSKRDNWKEFDNKWFMYWYDPAVIMPFVKYSNHCLSKENPRGILSWVSRDFLLKNGTNV